MKQESDFTFYQQKAQTMKQESDEVLEQKIKEADEEIMLFTQKLNKTLEEKQEEYRYFSPYTLNLFL